MGGRFGKYGDAKRNWQICFFLATHIHLLLMCIENGWETSETLLTILTYSFIFFVIATVKATIQIENTIGRW